MVYTVYMRVRDALGSLYSDETFADLFPTRGQPAETPWRLALVTVMQFAAGPSLDAAALADSRPPAESQPRVRRSPAATSRRSANAPLPISWPRRQPTSVSRKSWTLLPSPSLTLMARSGLRRPSTARR